MFSPVDVPFALGGYLSGRFFVDFPALTLLAGSEAAYVPNLPLGYSEVAGEFQVQAAGGFDSVMLTFLVL